MTDYRHVMAHLVHMEDSVIHPPKIGVDPDGKKAGEAGAKLDSGKADCGLLGLFGRSLYAVSELGTAGAKKYSRGGFLSVDDGFNRYTGAMLRHYLKEGREEYDQDPELRKYLEYPVLHATQVAWNALARLEFKLRELEEMTKND